MVDDKGILQAVFAIACTLATFMFGGWSMTLQVLVAFIAMDYLTGFGAAFVGKRLSSEEGSVGIAKKVGLMALVALAHLLDKTFGLAAPVLMTATTYFLIGNEGLSILENLEEIGVKIPEPIKDALDKLKSGKVDR